MCAGCGTPDGGLSSEITTFVFSPSAVSVAVPDSPELLCSERSTVASLEPPPQPASRASASMPSARYFTSCLRARGGAGFDNLERGAGHPVQRVELVVRPPAVRRAGDVPVGAV